MTDGMVTRCRRAQRIALRRTREVTKLLMFMAADATYSTGSEWIVDGGALLGPVLDLPQE